MGLEDGGDEHILSALGRQADVLEGSVSAELGHSEAGQQGALCAGLLLALCVIVPVVWHNLPVVLPCTVCPPLAATSPDNFVVACLASSVTDLLKVVLCPVEKLSLLPSALKRETPTWLTTSSPANHSTASAMPDMGPGTWRISFGFRPRSLASFRRRALVAVVVE